MMLSLPNNDGSHSGLIHANKNLLKKIETEKELSEFLHPLYTEVIIDLCEQFKTNKLGEFKSVHCHQWFKKNALIIGDASHGMVPFYGQGTNAGLEDVQIYMGLLKEYDFDFSRAAIHFQCTRPKDTNEIVKMSERNLNNLELSSTGFDDYFKYKKFELGIEKRIDGYHSEYFNIAFTNMPYKEIELLSTWNKLLLEELFNNKKDFLC